ncbi:recombination protein RecR [Mycoplasma flocculare]|uniref:recombination protein RecR n=1 Tax=Mesomycoplasma flocculare TaxID=2128 RepID=UPI00136CB1E0|nr:recombination protein RecR [Mesomycoplasma flocculare]MXR56066.1 recombination protein RecR [Mesomycoplasma flocculare]
MIKETFEKLAENLKQIPEISKKQAMKILYYLVDTPITKIENFVNKIYELKKNIKYCEKCGYLNTNPVCEICLDFQRSFKILVVENYDMVTKFEESGKYDIKKLETCDSQIEKIADLATGKCEIILGFSSTMEGWIIANYITKSKFLANLKITHLATEIPFGATIDYIDSITLEQTLKNCQEMEK